MATAQRPVRFGIRLQIRVDKAMAAALAEEARRLGEMACTRVSVPDVVRLAIENYLVGVAGT